MYYCYGKGIQESVLCKEVFPFSEGPLSEVPLYHTYMVSSANYLLSIWHKALVLSLQTSLSKHLGKLLSEI